MLRIIPHFLYHFHIWNHAPSHTSYITSTCEIMHLIMHVGPHHTLLASLPHVKSCSITHFFLHHFFMLCEIMHVAHHHTLLASLPHVKSCMLHFISHFLHHFHYSVCEPPTLASSISSLCKKQNLWPIIRMKQMIASLHNSWDEESNATKFKRFALNSWNGGNYSICEPPTLSSSTISPCKKQRWVVVVGGSK